MTLSEEAIEAAAEKIIDAVTGFARHQNPISGGAVAREALAAAEPHLRKKWAEEVRAGLVDALMEGVGEGGWFEAKSGELSVEAEVNADLTQITSCRVEIMDISGVISIDLIADRVAHLIEGTRNDD